MTGMGWLLSFSRSKSSFHEWRSSFFVLSTYYISFSNICDCMHSMHDKIMTSQLYQVCWVLSKGDEGKNCILQTMNDESYGVHLQLRDTKMFSKSRSRLSSTTCQPKGTVVSVRRDSVVSSNVETVIITRSSWLNCALRDDEAVYWVSIGHYEAIAVCNWWY